MRKLIPTAFLGALLAGVAFMYPGCAKEQGPMEKAGEAIDEAFDKDGPVEEAAEDAGEAIDDALSKSD